MRRFLIAVFLLVGCSNAPYNPVSPDYPCGTRAHVCSTTPLMCCWNSEVCGGPVGSGCPEGMCCADGLVGVKKEGDAGGRPSPQWH